MEEKKGRKKKIIVGILIGLLILIAAIALGGYFVFKHYYNMIDYQPDTQEEWVPYTEEEPEEEPQMEEASEDEIAAIEDELQANLNAMQENVSQKIEDADIFNILLVGVDSRKDKFSGRSDSMILVSINQKKKTVTMTSFLRDIYLSIPNHGSNRLNASYAYGGPELLKSTMKTNFGIEVDRYMTVNFYSVMEFVDAIGGVDIEISAAEIRVMNNYIKSHNKLLGNPEGTDILSEEAAGVVHLNGNQALAYARVRYVGTDFARTGRQRKILQLSLEKVKTMSLLEMSGMLEEFLPKVKTDLTEGDCASLLLMLPKASDYAMDTLTIPQDKTWKSANIRGMSVLTIDFKKNSDAWYNKVNGIKE